MTKYAIVLATVTPILLLWFMRPEPSVVTFDYQRVRGQFIQQLALHQVSDADVKSKNIRFKQSIQSVQTAYAQQHHVMILSHAQVLAGGKDVTELLMPLIATAMRGRV